MASQTLPMNTLPIYLPSIYGHQLIQGNKLDPYMQKLQVHKSSETVFNIASVALIA